MRSIELRLQPGNGSECPVGVWLPFLAHCQQVSAQETAQHILSYLLTPILARDDRIALGSNGALWTLAQTDGAMDGF